MRNHWKEGHFGPRLFGAVTFGLLAAGFAAAVVGFALQLLASAGVAPGWAQAYRAYLAEGGWIKLPLAGAALATLVTLRFAVTRVQLVLGGWMAFKLGGAALLAHAALPRERPADPLPVTAEAKSRAILRWSYRTPATVERILDLARDPDAAVRARAVLALGVNLLVTDVERASAERPSRFHAHPLRGRLRLALEAALDDPDPGVRAEAARALWKAPITFGPHPAAAETLAAALDRASGAERAAWLGVDAAAGAPHPALKASAARFAARTRDPELGRYARLAAAR